MDYTQLLQVETWAEIMEYLAIHDLLRLKKTSSFFENIMKPMTEYCLQRKSIHLSPSVQRAVEERELDWVDIIKPSIIVLEGKRILGNTFLLHFSEVFNSLTAEEKEKKTICIRSVDLWVQVVNIRSETSNKLTKTFSVEKWLEQISSQVKRTVCMMETETPELLPVRLMEQEQRHLLTQFRAIERRKEKFLKRLEVRRSFEARTRDQIMDLFTKRSKRKRLDYPHLQIQGRFEVPVRPKILKKICRSFRNSVQLEAPPIRHGVSLGALVHPTSKNTLACCSLTRYNCDHENSCPHNFTTISEKQLIMIDWEL